jgi:ABC-2 type transport system ATP-binding protein
MLGDPSLNTERPSSRSPSSNVASAVEVAELSKTFGRGLFGSSGKQVLHDVTIRVPRGQALGVIGPNGAGKTTLVKLLLTVVRPSSGKIRIFGEDPELPRIRRRIGYLPERLVLPASATPMQHLLGLSRIRRSSDGALDAERQLARVKMTADASRRMGPFSKGMKQRIGLAAALLGSPDLLVLDEPTDGLDPIGRAEFRDIVNEEKRRGATIILNSHLLAEAERICDAVAILSGGTVVAHGNVRELCTSKTRWRARFSPSSPEPGILNSGFVKADEPGSFIFNTEELETLNAALDRARAAGALLMELGPELRDLEDVLREAIGQ